MASELMVLKWKDEDDDVSTTTVHIPTTDATLADVSRIAFRDALAAASSASLYEESVNMDQVIAGAPAAADGPYSIADKAILAFKTALGTVVRISIPAPLAAIFLDDDVIDAGEALIEAIKTAAFSTLTDLSGNLVTLYMGGWRDRRNRARTS